VYFSSSSIVALSILFIHFYCPETKGKILEEIAKFFEWDSNHRISSSSGDGEFAFKQSEWDATVLESARELVVAV
jgi:hypothetical protein